MEINQILQEHKAIVEAHIPDIAVNVGMTVTSGNKSHINIYPATYSFSYDQEYCNIILEGVLPKADLEAGITFAQKCAEVIELDDMNSARLSSYDVEFFWNEQISGIIIIFSIMLMIQRCR